MVMCETSGLLYGELITRYHQEVTLANCRRIYSYSGACSIDQLAVEGSKEPQNCIVTCPGFQRAIEALQRFGLC